MIGRLFGALFEDFRDPWGNKRRAEEAERKRQEEEAERVRKERLTRARQDVRAMQDLYDKWTSESARLKGLREKRERLKARLSVGRVR